MKRYELAYILVTILIKLMKAGIFPNTTYRLAVWINSRKLNKITKRLTKLEDTLSSVRKRPYYF